MEIPENIKTRIESIVALIAGASSEGEMQAAKKALGRILSKYDLNEEAINNIGQKPYLFTYVTRLEEQLMIAIMKHFLKDYQNLFNKASKNPKVKRIELNLKYLDYITVDSAYEYFRRHMKTQWKKTCAPEVARCRKEKTRNQKRKDLQKMFLPEYLFKSGLLRANEIKQSPVTSKSQARHANAVSGIEGGKYNMQVQTAHMLPPSSEKVHTNDQGQISMFQ